MVESLQEMDRILAPFGSLLSLLPAKDVKSLRYHVAHRFPPDVGCDTMYVHLSKPLWWYFPDNKSRSQWMIELLARWRRYIFTEPMVRYGRAILNMSGALTRIPRTNISPAGFGTI